MASFGRHGAQMPSPRLPKTTGQHSHADSLSRPIKRALFEPGIAREPFQPLAVRLMRPGERPLPASYIKYLSDYYRDHASLVTLDAPGCTRETCNSNPTFEATILNYKQWFEGLWHDGVRTVFAHSWGALVFHAVLRDIPMQVSEMRATIWNPVPFDRNSYDAVVGRLMQRVTPAAAKEMETAASLGSEAGTRIMELAWPFYSPGAQKPRELNFDYFPATFASVSAGLADFDYWHQLLSISDQVELVFGTSDYIHTGDFERAIQVGTTTRIVAGGHFPFIEDPRCIESSLEWLTKSST